MLPGSGMYLCRRKAREQMGSEIEFSRPWPELSCIVGTLFEALDPPCGISADRGCVLTLFGKVRGSDETAVLRVYRDRCKYTGPPSALKAAMGGRCPEKGGCAGG